MKDLQAPRGEPGLRSKEAAMWLSLRDSISFLGKDRALIESKSHLMSSTFLTRKSINYLLGMILIYTECVS